MVDIFCYHTAVVLIGLPGGEMGWNRLAYERKLYQIYYQHSYLPQTSGFVLVVSFRLLCLVTLIVYEQNLGLPIEEMHF